MSCPEAKCRRPNRRDDESGFTLLELLIVTVVLPLIIGALSAGIIAVFSLQSGVTNRLTDTADSQVVAANFQKDVQSAAYVTTASSLNTECSSGTGTQLLGLESVLNQLTGKFQTVVSYVSVPVTSGSTTTYSLIRLFCNDGSPTPSSQDTLAYDFQDPSGFAPVISCQKGAPTSICSDDTAQWTQTFVPTEDIASITFNVTEPASSYNYNLVASPADSASFDSGGVSATPASPCDKTFSGTGPYGGDLCLLDFLNLTANDIAIARTTGDCYNMSFAISTEDLLHLCLSVTSNYPQESVKTTKIPTDTDAGLGDTVYAGLDGQLALYMDPFLNGYSPTPTVTETLSDIYVVNASTGQYATGWDFVSADAETIDSNEYMTWTSNVPITVLNDAGVGAKNPVGDACAGNVNNVPTGSGTTTVTCSGGNETGVLTGAAMVSITPPNSTTPLTLTVTQNNYSAVTFGMLAP